MCKSPTGSEAGDIAETTIDETLAALKTNCELNKNDYARLQDNRAMLDDFMQSQILSDAFKALIDVAKETD